MSSLDEDIFNEVMQNEPDSVCLRIKDWMGDLSSYQIGDTFKGYVSYLLQGDKKLCFIKDLSKFVPLNCRFFRPIFMWQIRNWIQFGLLLFQFDRPTSVDFKDYLESAFHGVPPYGYVFAVNLNQKYFRAIRVDSEVSWKLINSFYCFTLYCNGSILFHRHQICHFVFGWLILVKRFLCRQIWRNSICAIKQNDFHRWQFFATLKRYDKAFHLPPMLVHVKGKFLKKTFCLFV